ncbi:MAG: translocation/assembly module TamB domain-containing protein [Rhodobacterales bacterium]|nr:translocation/assembly module TamB domain-containing protein [Rhodobacterales bacterium]
MRAPILLALMLCAAPAHAQEDDRDFLTAFLEDNLSGAGRQVTITGFAGALAARATIESLTIADDQGVWLTLNGATLDWSRSSLLSGEVRVSDLSATEIILDRLPTSTEDTLPSAEATAFSLPELPVSIDIDRIAADRIVLGETVLGQAVEGKLLAAMTLAGGEGSASIELERTDSGPTGEIQLQASYANATRQLDLSLTADEGAGGIVVSLLGVPGAPSAAFEVQGSGPLEDHRATIRLATDGEDRLAGTVVLGEEPDGGYRLQASVGGNLAPMLVPEHVDFFGTAISLELDARRSTTGRVTLDRLSLAARSLQLEGRGTLAADGLPETIELTGTLATPDGEPVLLPFGAVETRIDRAGFSLGLQPGEGEGWSGDITLEGLDRADLSVGRLKLTGSGRIGRTPAGNSVGGTLRLTASGLLPTDPGLAKAIGTDLAGGLRFRHLEGSGAISLSDVNLAGDGLSAKGALAIEGLNDAFQTTGSLDLAAADLSRFSVLADRPMSGAASVRLSGSASPLSGMVDAEAEVIANDLTLGFDSLDQLLSGQSTARLSILRDESGTSLRNLDLMAKALTAKASGNLASDGSSLSATLSVTDLSALGPGFGGRADLQARFDGTTKDGDLSLSGSAQGLQVGNVEADKLLAGKSTLSATLALRDQAIKIDKARLENPQLSLAITGQLDALVRKLVIDARLANLGLLMPDLQGPLALSGSAIEDGQGYVLDLGLRGPGGIDGAVKGRIGANLSSADLVLAGTARAALANLFLSPRALDGTARYDLRLNGPFRVSSLSGRVTLSNGRFTDPNLGVSLEGIEALAQLQAGQAQVSSTARLSTGGLIRVDGPIGLAAPFPARLQVTLDRLRLIDPELYEALVDGRIGIDGPLTGGATLSGRLDLEQVDLRVPASGFESGSALLDVAHVNEPRDVRDTRARAGLIGSDGAAAGSSGSTQPFRLDLTVSAPSRIFLRGRGIDAELGGQIRLAGTTDAVVPSGGFDLIRGRLDILGKRLVLSEASLRLEGSLVPIIRVSAQSDSDGVTSIVTIDGPADDPEVTFTSVPELPQEEVLAHLLFGRDLGRLSGFQAAQLANAVATLAGRGGAGIVSRLRDGLGLDDFDLATADDGTTALTAGKYLTEKVYTEVEITQDGRTRANVNLDLRPGVTVRGRLDDDGDTGVGIFLERDY